MENMVIPYSEKNSSKKEQVGLMFDNIATSYDFLNHFLSLNIDKLWRKKAIGLLKNHPTNQILDLATGTADLAIRATTLNPKNIIGVDLSEKMLEIGRKKVEKAGLNSIIHLEQGDAEKLRFANNTFDTITIAFGVRNFENLTKGLAEMYRVLMPKGKCMILEFSKPTLFPFKQLYNLYFFRMLPFFGKVFSKDNSAYTYLPESVKAFPDGEAFIAELKKAGFKNATALKLSLGIATIYLSEK